MSSNIRIQRLCQQCGNEFTAKKTTSRTCSDRCAKALYKQKKREERIESSNIETKVLKAKPLEVLKAKEFLTVNDVAKLLNSSRQTIYALIKTGRIKAVNLKLKKTLIKRSEIDKLFN
jgi:excisionase family DNA binding protein